MATLQDVIVSLKQQGELNRKAIEESTSALIDAFTDTIEVFGQQMAMPGALLPIQEEEPDGIPGTDGDSKEEEDKREERKIFQRLIDTMEGVGKAMESLSDSILDTVGKAGKAAGIATLLALFIKPEFAMEVIGKAINVFNDGLTAIGDMLSGSTEGLTNFIQNHPIVTGVGTTLVVVKLVGVIGGLLSSLSTTLVTIGGTIGGIVSGFTTVAGVLTGVTGLAIGPLIAAIAGIGLAIYGLVNAFSDAFKVWDETGSALETLKAFLGSLFENTLGLLYDLAKGAVKLLVGAIGSILSGIFSLIKNAIMFTLQLIGESIIAMFANIVGFVPNLLKSLVSSIVGFLGFDNLEAAIDDFDFVQFIKDGIYGLGDVFVNTLMGVFEYISEIPSKILGYIKSAASKIPVIGSLFSDDEEQTSATEKKLTVTTKEGETKQLTQNELVDAVTKGEVSTEAAKTAIEDSKKYAVTTKEGETEYLTRDELIKRRRSNGMQIDTANRVFAADPYTAREGEVLSQEQMNSLINDSSSENSNVVSLSDVRARSSSDTDRVVSIGANFSSDRVFSNNVSSSDRAMSNNVSDRVFSNNVSSSDRALDAETLIDNNRVTLNENTKSSESLFSQIGNSVSSMITTGLQGIPIIGDLFKTESLSTADTSIANTSGLSSSSNVISMKDYKESVANEGGNVNLSRNFASNPYTAREGEYLSQEQMNSILGGSESNQMEISSVESPITSLYKTTQAENTALSSQSSSTAEQTVAAIAPMIAALGVGGGSSNRTNNNISNTSVTNNFSPDTLSREFIYRPA